MTKLEKLYWLCNLSEDRMLKWEGVSVRVYVLSESQSAGRGHHFQRLRLMVDGEQVTEVVYRAMSPELKGDGKIDPTIEEKLAGDLLDNFFVHGVSLFLGSKDSQDSSK